MPHSSLPQELSLVTLALTFPALTLQDGEQGCIQGEKDRGISKWSTYQMIFHTLRQIPPHTALT